MAKPTITALIRMNGRSFVKGQETELLDASTPELRKEWLKKGFIEGDWSASGFEPEEEPEIETDEIASSEAVPEALVEEIRTKEIESVNNALEASAAQISAQLGIERSSDESPFAFIERFAHEEVEQIANAIKPLEGVSEPSSQPSVLRQIVSIRPDVAEALEKAGFSDGATIRATEDGELRKVTGVGDATLKQLRDLFGEYQPQQPAQQ